MIRRRRRRRHDVWNDKSGCERCLLAEITGVIRLRDPTKERAFISETTYGHMRGSTLKHYNYIFREEPRGKWKLNQSLGSRHSGRGKRQERADVGSLPRRALYRSYLYRKLRNNLDTWERRSAHSLLVQHTWYEIRVFARVRRATRELNQTNMAAI